MYSFTYRHPDPHTTRLRSGMTLLEVVLAITALASISTLVAALWAQTNDWTNENAAHQTALKLEQTLSLLDEQWDARVLTLSLAGVKKDAIRLDDAKLTFITSAPILFRDWPLVRVSYAIERVGGLAVGDVATYRLRYEETRIRNPASATEDASKASQADTRALTLLDRLPELRWERYVDESDSAGADAEAPPPGWAAIGGAVTVAVAKRAGKGDQNQSAGADQTPPSGSVEATPSGSVEKTPSGSQDGASTPLRAGRLVGVHRGERFAWQFLADPSH